MDGHIVGRVKWSRVWSETACVLVHSSGNVVKLNGQPGGSLSDGPSDVSASEVVGILSLDHHVEFSFLLLCKFLGLLDDAVDRDKNS